MNFSNKVQSYLIKKTQFRKIFKWYGINKTSKKNNNSIINEYNKTRELPLPIACYAPFSNMIIMPTGKVMACCYNGIKISDDISKKSLNEIWFGEKFNNLRNAICNNNFEIGCTFCKSLLLNKNYYSIPARRFDNYKRIRKYPRSIQLIIENTCNLACIMCNDHSSSKYRKQNTIKPPMRKMYPNSLVEELKEFIPHLDNILFSGGESFLIKKYYEIWEYIITNYPKLRITVNTNGTILNDNIKNIINKGQFDILFSIDSLNKNTYEKIRINANFENVIDNLYFFNKYCKKKGTYFEISFCPMRLNWDEIPNIVLFCNKQSCSINFLQVIKPGNCALWNWGKENLTPIYEKLNKIKLPNDTEIEKLNNKKFQELISLIGIWKDIVIPQNTNCKIDNNALQFFKKEILAELEINKDINGKETISKKIIEKIDFLFIAMPYVLNFSLVNSLFENYPRNLIFDELLFVELPELINHFNDFYLEKTYADILIKSYNKY